jgi:hypothetical protein
MLDLYPVNVVGDPLAVCLLKDIVVVNDAAKFERQLDALDLLSTQRYVIWSREKFSDRFPMVKVEQEWDIDLLSDRIFSNFENFKRLLIAQSQIRSMILRNCYKYDVIVLIVADGLSYFDVPLRTDCVPCFVDGMTKTYEGYRNVIGWPTIGSNLFARGFTNLVGFSYWDRNCDPGLTEQIFVPFGLKEPTRVGCFEEVIERIAALSLRKTYIQIVTHGLDQLCHKSYEQPLIEAHVERLLKKFDELGEVVREKKRTGMIYLTADHGILWKNRGRLEIIHEELQEASHCPRYLDGKILRDYTFPVSSWGKNYSLIRYPYITRALKRNEWGVHGGLSAPECIIPLLIKEMC